MSEPRGPIELFLRETGTSLDLLREQLRDGDVGATVIFAADVIYDAIKDVSQRVENLDGAFDSAADAAAARVVKAIARAKE